MAAEIRARSPHARIRLVANEEGTGVFTVRANDTELWNKHDKGGFPEPGEIVALLFH